MKTPASSPRVSGDMNVPQTAQCPPTPSLKHMVTGVCLHLRLQSLLLHLWFHCGAVENDKITWWFQSTAGKGSGEQACLFPVLHNQSDPVPWERKSQFHLCLHLPMLTSRSLSSWPLPKTQTWFHYPSQIRGHSWSCWDWIFLANLHKTSA